LIDSAGTPPPSSSATSATRPLSGGDTTTTIAVALASAGRPELLAEALASCAAQRGVTFTGIVSVPDEASLPADHAVLDGWTIVTGARGLAAQRNAALDAVGDVDLVAFFDDDAVLRPDYLANAVRFLSYRPDVVGLTGRVLLDGATLGEVDRAAAADALARSATTGATARWRPARELYGCNFVARAVPAVELRFDARLPFYSWLEDHDFARRLMRRGLLAEVDDCVIVHRGAASGGRQSHLRLGYSQVMNPVYLHRKGSFPAWLAVQQIFRPVAKNLALAAVGRASPWRRERLRGNVLAVCDVLRGRITPERITRL
jgi:GT2 family glycosyltransferase